MAVEAKTDANSIVLNLDAAFETTTTSTHDESSEHAMQVDGAAPTGDKKTKDAGAPIIIDEVNEEAPIPPYHSSGTYNADTLRCLRATHPDGGVRSLSITLQILT